MIMSWCFFGFEQRTDLFCVLILRWKPHLEILGGKTGKIWWFIFKSAVSVGLLTERFLQDSQDSHDRKYLTLIICLFSFVKTGENEGFGRGFIFFSVWIIFKVYSCNTHFSHRAEKCTIHPFSMPNTCMRDICKLHTARALQVGLWTQKYLWGCRALLWLPLL